MYQYMKKVKYELHRRLLRESAVLQVFKFTAHESFCQNTKRATNEEAASVLHKRVGINLYKYKALSMM